jgi:glutamate decarboxylase
MADQLLNDIRFAITDLEALEYPTTTRIKMEKSVPLQSTAFNHTGR